jgi:uncharacterized protein YecE (DUF72 family)
VGARAYVGTSGYVYPHWRRRFYPTALPVREWLPFYAHEFVTVELNNPFYRLPSAEAFAGWRRAVPRRFVFAVKASRFLTHMKKLKDPEAPLRLLLGRARALGATLGPILFQLPGNFHLDLARLDRFLRALGRQRLVRDLRATLEVRHASWLDVAALSRLERAGLALCFADWRDVPITGPVTADFVYVRRHGTAAGGYSEAALRADARAVRGWLDAGRDVYVYFNNDAKGYAVRNARRLAELLAS